MLSFGEDIHAALDTLDTLRGSGKKVYLSHKLTNVVRNKFGHLESFTVDWQVVESEEKTQETGVPILSSASTTR